MHGREILPIVDIHAARFVVLQSCQSSQIHQIPSTTPGRSCVPNSPSSWLQKAQPGSSSSSRDSKFVNILEQKFCVPPGPGRLGLRRQQIRKEKRGCPGGAGAEPRMERDQGMRGGRGSLKLLKCYFYLPHFLLGGRLVSAPPSLGPSCLDLPVPFSSGCLLPRLEDKRKRGRRAW